MGGAGGFALGMTQGGFSLEAKREIYNLVVHSVYKANRELLPYVSPYEMTKATDRYNTDLWTVPRGEVVFGCPPIVATHIMQIGNKKASEPEIAAKLLQLFIQFAAQTRALVVVFDATQVMYNRPGGREEMLRLHAMLEQLTGKNFGLYHIRYNTYYAGSCSRKQRYFWVASQVPFGIDLSTLVKPGTTTLKDAIGDLQDMPLNWEAQPYVGSCVPSPWVTPQLSRTNQVDGHIIYESTLARRSADIANSVEWNADEDLHVALRRYYNQFGYLPESWNNVADTMIKSDFTIGFTQPKRCNMNHPASSMTIKFLNNAFHPTLNRMLTYREAARIAGFPDDYRLSQSRRYTMLRTIFGSGADVHASAWIARFIKQALDGNPSRFTGIWQGSREYMIDLRHGKRSAATGTPSIIR